MNEITMWNYEGSNVRTLEIEGETWFVGKDVAEVLGYSNTRDALAKHVDDEDKGVAKCDTLGGVQDLTVINESGVYSLIFGSKLSEAKRFKHWVTSVVLPTIRKTGSYSNVSPMLQYLIQLEHKQNETQSQLDHLRETFAIDRDNWKEQCNDIVQKIALKRYNDISITFFIWQEAFELLDERLGVDTMTRLKNIKKRMKERGVKKTDIRKVKRFEVLYQDKKLRDGFITIIREMALKYNV